MIKRLGPLLTALLVASGCGGSDSPEASPSPSVTPTAATTETPSVEVSPTATVTAEFPITLAGIEFQGEPSTGPELCNQATEVTLEPDFAALAGTPFQMFGSTLPAGVTYNVNGNGIDYCGDRIWHAWGDYALAQPPNAFTIVRVFRPESWTQQEGVQSPQDLRVVTVGSQEAVFGFARIGDRVFDSYVWYSVPFESGYIVTRFAFNPGLTEDQVLAVVQSFLELDP